MKGLFITLEGGEGSGKTTAAARVLELLEGMDIPCLYTREPGGIPIAEEIRRTILNPAHTEMDGHTEALLYAAARRQHLVEKVKPALDAGMVVVCDRFVDSSIAYQGFARGIGEEKVYEMNQFAIDGFLPDLTIFFDLPPQAGLARIASNSKRHVDRLDLEGLAFHEAVYEGYLRQAKRFPERIVSVDASQGPEELAHKVLTLILNKWKQGGKLDEGLGEH